MISPTRARAEAILAETGASSATISRVKRSLEYGAGGYELVLKRIANQEQSDAHS